MKALVEVAAAAYDRATTPELKRVSKEVMADPAAPAVALMVAARHLLGEGFQVWEPETLHHELDAHILNQGKLAAAMALDVMPSFYWDYRVFANTSIVFNDGITIPDQLPMPTPLELTWGILEAELIFALTTKEAVTPEFDSEPTANAARQLYEYGWVCVPENMAFCEEELNKLLSPEARQLRTDSVQLAHLEDARLYLVNRTKAVTEYLKKL